MSMWDKNNSKKKLHSVYKWVHYLTEKEELLEMYTGLEMRCNKNTASHYNI